jgi:hypothetical protein
MMVVISPGTPSLNDQRIVVVVGGNHQSRGVQHLGTATLQGRDQICRSTVGGDADPKSAEHVGRHSGWSLHDHESFMLGSTRSRLSWPAAEGVDHLGGMGKLRGDGYDIADHYHGRELISSRRTSAGSSRTGLITLRWASEKPRSIAAAGVAASSPARQRPATIWVRLLIPIKITIVPPSRTSPSSSRDAGGVCPEMTVNDLLTPR